MLQSLKLAQIFVDDVKSIGMKKNKENHVKEDDPQSGKDVKDLPIKTAVTDNAKNSASQTPGLNQAGTTNKPPVSLRW